MSRWGRRKPVKDNSRELSQFRARAFLGFVIVLGTLLGLAGWYFKLQVLDHDIYAKRSESNRIKPRPIVPARGLIYDRKGRIIADNISAFRLDVVPEQAGDLTVLLNNLGKIIPISEDEIKAFEQARKAAGRSFRPVTLKLRMTEEEIAQFLVDQWRFPGVTVEPYLTRRYPYTDLMAHIIGYVGRTSEKDIEQYGEKHSVFTHTGRAGLERFYEEQLRGQVGFEQVETNVDGRELGRIGKIAARAGTDLRLSVDLDLQQAMVNAFADYDGAAVAIEPKTGEVLAMVSLPSYDANLFVNGISNKDYRRLMDNPSRPLFNRNVQGGGPPGSTIKPFVGLAGLESGLRTPQSRVFSTGEYFIPGQRRGYRDAYRGAGWTDLNKSIAASVNYYYYKLADDMGIERFDEYMRKYGFGQPTGIDLTGENAGVVPSPAWKAKNSKLPWYRGETVIAGIGQGYWVATTLQLAVGTAAIAADGMRHQPHLAKEARLGFDHPWTAIAQPVVAPLSSNRQYVAAVKYGMENTIHGPGGTGRGMAVGAQYRMAGKTGTVQKISRKGSASLNPKALPLHLRHQALFVGYAPAEDPKIAVALIVEHGGYGGSTAAPIARKIFDAWLLGTDGLGQHQQDDQSNTAIATTVFASPQKDLDESQKREIQYQTRLNALKAQSLPVLGHLQEAAPQPAEDKAATTKNKGGQ